MRRNSNLIKNGKIIVDEERLIELFMELVRIDSISLQERKMTDRLIDELESLSFRVEEDAAAEAIDGNSGNLIAYLEGKKEYPVLFLSAHMDRVEPGKNIKPYIEGEYIYSKGETVLAADDIVGIVCILEALRQLKENNIEHGDIIVCFTVAEEIGLLGSKELDQKYIDCADYGLVLDVDGDVGSVVYKAPGQIKFKACIRGKAAHAGVEPQKGINAIKIASKAISDMQLGQVNKDTTANIGVIKGGRAINIIPEIVELEGEVRSHCEEALEDQKEKMIETLNKAAQKYSGSVEFNIEELYRGFELDRESDIINMLNSAFAEMDIEMELMCSGGGSDANIYNQKGLATVNLSVGMENVHSTSERVKIANMVNTVYLILNTIIKSRDYCV